jgi:hypothetical protein
MVLALFERERNVSFGEAWCALQSNRVRTCDRTTSEMRGLSPKIILGDSHVENPPYDFGRQTPHF